MEAFRVDSEQDLARLVHAHRYAQVGMCVSGVTHDINNLLGAAMAYAELASIDESNSPETNRMLGQIVDGVTKCSNLIKALTAVARKDRPDVNLSTLHRVLEEVFLLRDYELKIAQINFDKDLDADIPALPLDLPKLKAAVLYLLVNAEQAVAGIADRQIKVTAGKTGDGAYIDVWDSGRGLASEHAERAFEPLTSFWPGGGHLGMGLFAARAIARRHGGDLTYIPETGFRLTILRENELRDEL